MAATFVGVLAVPGLRDFYELRLPGGDVIVESLAIAFAAIVALETLLRGTGAAPAPGVPRARA
jgi:hypothetical protein